MLIDVSAALGVGLRSVLLYEKTQTNAKLRRRQAETADWVLARARVPCFRDDAFLKCLEPPTAGARQMMRDPHTPLPGREATRRRLTSAAKKKRINQNIRSCGIGRRVSSAL